MDLELNDIELKIHEDDIKIHEDIQPNYQLLLENYPFIKVFSQPVNPPIFENIDEFITEMKGDYMFFKINFEAEKPFSITTYVEKNQNLHNVEWETITKLYEKYKEQLQQYINYQLVNSGILDTLSDIPTQSITSKNNKTFNSSICIRLSVHTNSIPQTQFHHDNTLYHILQYVKPDFVLSSELLFYHDDRVVTHMGTENNEFPTEKYGTTVHDKYETVKKIYKQIKEDIVKEDIEKEDIEKDDIENSHIFLHRRDLMKELKDKVIQSFASLLPHVNYKMEKKIYRQIQNERKKEDKMKIARPALLRHKLMNGDTMVWADTLLKHAVINPTEKRKKINDEKILTIDIDTNNYDTAKIDVKICNKRIETNKTHHKGRKVIALFVFINDKENLDTSSYYKGETFNINDSVRNTDIPSVNLDQEQCKEMFKSLYNADSCVELHTSDGNLFSLVSRGGRNYRLKNKNFKTKTKKVKKYLKQYRGRLSGANPKLGNKFKRIKQIKTKKINIIRKNRFIKHNQFRLSRKHK